MSSAGYPARRGIVRAKRICKQHWYLSVTELIHVNLQLLWITALGVAASVKQLSSWEVEDQPRSKRGRILPHTAIPGCGQVVSTVHAVRKFITAAVMTCRPSMGVNATVVRCVLLLSCQPLCMHWICCLQFTGIHHSPIFYSWLVKIDIELFAKNWIKI